MRDGRDRNVRRAAGMVWAAVFVATPAAAQDPVPSRYEVGASAAIVTDVTTTSMASAARGAFRGTEQVADLVAEGTGPLAVTSRLAIAIAVDLPILSYQLVIPHEVFGHGAS